MTGSFDRVEDRWVGESTGGTAPTSSLGELLGPPPRPVSWWATVEALRAGDEAVARRLATELWDGRERYQARTFGELFPGLDRLPDSSPLEQLGVRSRNSLYRGGMHTWERLARSSVGRLCAQQNLGRISFVEIARSVLIAWASGTSLESADDSAADEAYGDHPVPRALSAASSRPEPQRPASTWWPDVEVVLGWLWQHLGARTMGEGLAIWPDTDPPAGIRDAAGRLLGLHIEELLGLDPPSEMSWLSLLEFEPREAAIARQRVFATSDRLTLDRIGRALGVTRERARQLEVRVNDTLGERLAGGESAAIRHLAAHTARKIGMVAPERHARAILDEAVRDTSEPPYDDQDLRVAVLTSLCGPYARSSGLWWSATARQVLQQAQLDLAEAGAIIDTDTADQLLRDLGAPDEYHADIVASLGLRPVAGRLVVWTGSRADKSVGVLRAYARPLSSVELHEAVGFDTNPRSLMNQVQGDARIARLGKDLYGLREWGEEEYSGIMTELEQAIERDGGRADLRVLVDRFVEQFGVSASSVMAYAADRRFIRNGDGTISLRGGEDPAPGFRRLPIETTRGAFRLGGVWHLRIEVDDDVMRGSGQPLRVGAALEAGLEPDLTFGLDYGDAEVVFSWSSRQPLLGSIRSIALANGATVGDLVFLPLTGTEPRCCRIARATIRAQETALRRLAIETGLDPDSVDPDDPIPFATVIGLPPGADWADIAERLRQRGETTLLPLLPGELL